MLKKIKILDYARCKEKFKKNILIGAGFSFFLFIITFVFYLNFSYMGARNKEIEDYVFKHFKWLIAWINLKILLVYIVIGLIIGIFSLLLNIKKKRNIILFNMFFWFMFWIRGIKLYPQMFTEQLYRKGVLLKYFQVLITDFTPLFVIYLIFILTIVTISIRNKRIVYSFLILLVSLSLVVRFKVSPVKKHEGGKTAPNVLVFATDSLRPKSISYNGYFRKTPNIDGLFSRGVNFLKAKSSLARTLPSWTSVFTSTFPPDHNLRHMFPPLKDLQKNRHTMIDIFNRHNYYTAVIADFAGDIFPGINYGFQEVAAPGLSLQNAMKQRSQEIHYFLMGFLFNPAGLALFPEMEGMTLNKDPWYVTENTKKSIKKALKKNKPFFILYFSSNNHFPYVTKYPYYQLYTPKNYYGKHKYGLSSDVLESFLGAKVEKDEIPRIINHYDHAVKLFDDNLGEILAFLKKCNIEKNTVVVVMSDHGENLYEENYGIAHGNHLLGPYSCSMVFGIYSPFEDFKGLRVEETVRDIDIAPTILDLLKMEIPATFKGHSLLPVMRGADFPGYPAYMETGIWYSTKMPYLDNQTRIPYPEITKLARLEMPWGKISLKDEFEEIVIRAKYRAYQLNEKKYIYMPGEPGYIEEFYIDEKLVAKEDIADEEFLSFKEKMVEMFKGKFYIDEKGFIREHMNGNKGAKE